MSRSIQKLFKRTVLSAAIALAGSTLFVVLATAMTELRINDELAVVLAFVPSGALIVLGSIKINKDA